MSFHRFWLRCRAERQQAGITTGDTSEQAKTIAAVHATTGDVMNEIGRAVKSKKRRLGPWCLTQPGSGKR
jgi:hypothetical protein